MNVPPDSVIAVLLEREARLRAEALARRCPTCSAAPGAGCNLGFARGIDAPAPEGVFHGARYEER